MSLFSHSIYKSRVSQADFLIDLPHEFYGLMQFLHLSFPPGCLNKIVLTKYRSSGPQNIILTISRLIYAFNIIQTVFGFFGKRSDQHLVTANK